MKGITIQMLKGRLAAACTAALAKLFPALEATYNYKGGTLGGTAEGMVYSPERNGVAKIKLDFAAIAAARVAAGQAAIAAADVLQVVGVKAGTYVPYVALQVVTAEGATGTVDVGDGDDTDGFLNNTDINAVGRTASLVTTAYSVAVGGGKWYNADDTIDVVVNDNDTAVAVCYLFVPMQDLRSTT